MLGTEKVNKVFSPNKGNNKKHETCFYKCALIQLVLFKSG